MILGISDVLECHLLSGNPTVPAGLGSGGACCHLPQGRVGSPLWEWTWPGSDNLPRFFLPHFSLAQFLYPCTAFLLPPTGIHYIGRMKEGSPGRFILDQITEGQLDWALLCPLFDMVVLERPDGRKEFPMYSGRKAYIQGLKEKFPQEEAVIDKYMQLVQVMWTLFIPRKAELLE